MGTVMIIYKVTNLINGKVYVGQSVKNDKWYFGSGTYIKRAIEKYGLKNFKREIVCECNDREELNELEIHYIKELNCKIPNGYNISDGGDSGPGLFGDINPSKRPEVKEKMRKRMLGEGNPSKREDVKKKISEKNKGRKINYSEYGMERLVETSRERFINNNPMSHIEFKEKLLKIVKSEEYRKRMSEATKGNKNGMYGKNHSEETREKIRKRIKEYWKGKKNETNI
ncbi:MAG: NUMOD3 domain-containing DNA-binding protein [Methanobacterium sp.]